VFQRESSQGPILKYADFRDLKAIIRFVAGSSIANELLLLEDSQQQNLTIHARQMRKMIAPIEMCNNIIRFLEKL
jgi:hypothetical protein